MNGKQTIIVDYKLSNLFSVKRACDTVGINARVSARSSDIDAADAIILPGVGSFGEAMSNLKELDLIRPILDAANAGKPLFGICLGLQLLLTESEEFGNHQGLDLIPGCVRKFRSNQLDGPQYKVPFIGWNRIQALHDGNWTNTPLEHTPQDEHMYFVHSYFAETSDRAHTLSQTRYGTTNYASSILHKNLFATQFHPEKSGSIGLSIYQAWGLNNKLIN